MLEALRQFLQNNPKATNFQVAQAFSLSRDMANRYLEWLEDAGDCILDRPAEVCTGCGPKPETAPSGGACGVNGPAARLNALAENARRRRDTVAG
ncbi:MAG: winged helix-turn-helix domain-containing protein [Candidatus Sericytochromatia bacterium]|nr:winged helix-turn-helix domain-containing protein [Candidatus Sericytochromatia bacterium]